jgi:uncharacterized secreted protein with C-terminal beta-propeller domain
MKTKKKSMILCFFLVLMCLFSVNAQAATQAKEGIYKKVYTPSASFQVYMKPSTSLVVTKIKAKKISFVVEYYGINGSPIYQTNTITATLKNNKVSKFKWKDSWGNSGTGSLKFSGKKVTVAMKTLQYAQFNRWGWSSKVTLTYSRKLTTKQKKYYSTLDF